MKILDIGCGTGLSGQAFKGLSSSLTGIDISQKMLEIAASKEIYDSLHAIGIEDYLQNTTSSYSFVIAADVFAYIGELETIFNLVCKTVESGAFFCFSIEKCENDNFKLNTTGRFAHSFYYIKKISLSAGWEIINYCDADLRKEKNKWIQGMLFFLQKRID